MTGDTADIHALSGAYALDALDGDEAIAFERHLESCASCRDEVRSLRETLPALADASAEEPPTRLRGAVLSSLGSVRPLPPIGQAAEATSAPVTPSPAAEAELARVVAGPAHSPAPGEAPPAAEEAATAPAPGPGEPAAGAAPAAGDELAAARARRGRRSSRWLAGAAAALVLVAGAATYRAVSLDRQLTSVSTTAAQVSAVLTSPDATTVSAPVSTGGRAAVVVSDSLGQAVLVTDGLPPAPTGRTYQVWYLGADGSAASAGFVPDSDTSAVLLSGDASAATGVGVTLEPAGGSPQPTTTPVLALSV